MARSRIQEVNYHVFMAELKRAADTGARIEPSNKADWKTFVRAHQVKEASFLSIASGKGEGFKPVIIRDGDWSGYYLYSTIEQVSLKFVREGVTAAAAPAPTAEPAAEPEQAETPAETPAEAAESTPAAEAGETESEGGSAAS